MSSDRRSSRFDLPKALALIALGVACALGINVAYATWAGDPNVALSRGFSLQASPALSGDMLVNNGVYDSASGHWVRSPAGPGGVTVVTSCVTHNINQQAVSTSAAVPASPQANRDSLCIFNQDTAATVFCGDTTPALTTNGVLIEPRVGRCLYGSGPIYCITSGGTGTATIDYVECGP